MKLTVMRKIKNTPIPKNLIGGSHYHMAIRHHTTRTFDTQKLCFHHTHSFHTEYVTAINPQNRQNGIGSPGKEPACTQQTSMPGDTQNTNSITLPRKTAHVMTYQNNISLEKRPTK